MPTSPKQLNIVEPASYIWHKLLVSNRVPANGIVIEVAPGYEPKIGNALSMLGFRGTIFLIEPDGKTARHIQGVYQKILPQATVKTVHKFLQEVRVGVDIPCGADAVIASHPFDDMVIAAIVHQAGFFSQEKEDGMSLSPSIRKLYDTLRNEDYARGISATIATWENFIESAKPDYFIASQYPSRMLTIKKLAKRQNSGFIVLEQLKMFYKNSLVRQCRQRAFGRKGDPGWWIVAKKPRREDPSGSIMQQPFAIKRLGESLFVPQRARRLSPKEYDIAYIDKKYFKNLKHDAASKQIRDLAIILDNESAFSSRTVITYADRQKDKTNIGLDGNQGAGRAVYCGDRFNILGVGKTTLCKSDIPSHSTGRLEIVGAMRRIILSKWINYFAQRAPEHPVLFALKETARFKWASSPIPLGLLVRIDSGSLDRPSHVEQSPQISIDFEKTLTEYAKLDAEYFAYRIMLGAWSTSNYSLSGHIIDLESATFVKCRGPYYTASSKHPHNRFGYEGLGFLKILRQLADVKNIKNEKIESRFYAKRRKRLALCFLSLLGINDSLASDFFAKHQTRVMNLSDQFERLSKKINNQITNLNLYMFLPDDQDPSLLDMSNLFRNLAKLYKSPDGKTEAFQCLVRQTALSQIKPGAANIPTNQWEACARGQVVVTRDQIGSFLSETKNFIRTLFQLLVSLDSEKCLGKKRDWYYRLQAMNQNLPAMFELNKTLKSLAESYRLGAISPKTLDAKINQLCDLPNIKRPSG